MKEVKTTNQFLRDLKLARKRGKDLRKIENVVDTLARGPTRPNTARIAFRVR